MKERYFKRTASGRYQVIDEIRQMVAFSRLNLVDEVYPSAATGTEAVDVILCRNVLMYFSPAQRRKVVARLGAALTPGGWLAVSPSEASNALFMQLRSVEFPGAILFEKPGPAVVAREPEPAWQPAPAAAPPSTSARAEADEVPREPRRPPRAAAADVAELAVLARSFADQGRLDDALGCCERWLAVDRLDPQAHYLRALVLIERGGEGDAARARPALQSALYLQPDFPVAQAALDHLARERVERDPPASGYAVDAGSR